MTNGHLVLQITFLQLYKYTWVTCSIVARKIAVQAKPQKGECEASTSIVSYMLIM